jgi:poly(A) polymerase
MRLNKIPGRRPDALAARKDFSDIIEYCRVTRGNRNDVVKQLEWWTAQALQTLATLPPVTAEGGTTPKGRKKRRRRRGKPQTKNMLEGTSVQGLS